MNDEERVICCQKEIRRLRNIVRIYEAQRNNFYRWLQAEERRPVGQRPKFSEVRRQFEELFDYQEQEE